MLGFMAKAFAPAMGITPSSTGCLGLVLRSYTRTPSTAAMKARLRAML